MAGDTFIDLDSLGQADGDGGDDLLERIEDAGGAVGASGDEAFLPWLREDLQALCLAEGALATDERALFEEFCEHLCTYLHLDFHNNLRTVERFYAHFDPDRDTMPIGPGADLARYEDQVVRCFRELAERSNYHEVSAQMIEGCVNAAALIDLKTKVDLNDFDRVLCFARGDILSTATVRKLWKPREVQLDILQRVVLLLKPKPDSYFQATGRTRKDELLPEKIYTFYYKNVPKNDLEFLFPNVEIGMTLKDKLLLGVPAIGGSVFVLIKLLPKILIVTGLVVFLIAGPEAARRIGVTDDSVSQLLPVLTAVFGLVIALGGFAVKQWNAVRRKRFEFLKNVAEQLFYRKLANNQAVFDRLFASAESEEAKEMILCLFHLWTGAQGTTPAQLDARLERWIKERLDAEVDFDIDGPVSYLTKVGGPEPLLEIDPEGRLHALPLPRAVARMRDLVTDLALGDRRRQHETPGAAGDG